MNKKFILSFALLTGVELTSYANNYRCCNSNLEINNYSENRIYIMQVCDWVENMILNEEHETGENAYVILENLIYDKAFEFYGEENWDESLEFWFTNLNIKNIYQLENFLMSETWLMYFINGDKEMAEKAWESQYM